MFCSNCGAKNSDEAIFCQKCAFRLEADEEETRVRVPQRRENPVSPKMETPVLQKQENGEDLEKQVFSIRPTMLFIKIGYGAAVASAFLLVWLLLEIGRLAGVDIPWWFSVLAGLSLLLIPAFYHLKRNTVRYTLTESKIEIDQGFISQNTRNVPLRTIQDVAVSSTIPQRLLGFGNLVIENASEAPEGKIVLKNINSPKKYADVLLRQMRQLDK